MLYLLDASVLIDAKNKYYPIERVPQFWEWIINNAEHNRIKIPYEILRELEAGKKEGELFKWVKTNKKNLLLDEQVDHQLLINEVMEQGYEIEKPTIIDLRKIGRDPFLIAYALASPDRCVVTLEASKPSAKRANRRIPDVCEQLNIRCIDTFAMLRELDFRAR